MKDKDRNTKKEKDREKERETPPDNINLACYYLKWWRSTRLHSLT